MADRLSSVMKPAEKEDSYWQDAERKTPERPGAKSAGYSSQLAMSAPKQPAPERRMMVVNAEKKHALRGHAGSVQCLAFSPDSTRLATGSDDKTVRMWDVTSGNMRNIFGGHKGKIYGLEFIGSGTILFSTSKDNTVMEWDLLRSEHRLTLTGHSNTVWSVCIVQEGQVAVSVSHDESIRWWDIMKGDLLHTIKGGPGTDNHTSTIYIIKPSPDGKMFATGSADKTIRVYNVQTKALVKVLVGHTSHVLGLAWLPGCKGLVSGSWDETIRVWDLETGASTCILSTNSKVNSVAVSQDGDCIVSGGEDKIVRLWRISTQECFKTFNFHKDEVMSVAFSPDGRYMASCGNDSMAFTYSVTRL